MRTIHLIVLLAALSCVPKETGIDNSRIDGQVTLGPLTRDEADDPGNDASPESMGALTPAAIIQKGTFRSVVTGDIDLFTVSSPVDIAGQVIHATANQGTIRVELLDGAGNVASSADITGSGTVPFFVPSGTSTSSYTYSYTDTGVTDTGTVDTGSGSTDTGTTSSSSTTTEPPFTGDGMVAGFDYVIRVTSVDAPTGSRYELTIPGFSPDNIQVLVGAWQESDITERTFPVAGTNATAWTGGQESDGWLWTGSYSMFLIRSLESEATDDGGEEVVGYDEDLEKVYLFAGTWSSLNQGLPAGTRYSAEPVEVVLDQEPDTLLATDAAVYTPGLLSLDTVAPIVIGFETTETEPNDGGFVALGFPPELDLAATDADATDLGVMSGPGFVDIITGSITFNGTYYDGSNGYGSNDVDMLKFTVPEASGILINLGWDTNNADLDLYIFDSAGEAVEGAASYDNPELGGGTYTFLPDETYYLMIAGYLSYDGAETAYELRLEQTGP